MQRSAKQIHKYSRQTREKPEWKTRGGAAPEDFPQGFFLEFGVNILCSAEQSSAYCHYSSFFGRHNHSIFTPRGDIEYQIYTVKYTPLHLSTVAPKNVE